MGCFGICRAFGPHYGCEGCQFICSVSWVPPLYLYVQTARQKEQKKCLAVSASKPEQVARVCLILHRRLGLLFKSTLNNKTNNWFFFLISESVSCRNHTHWCKAWVADLYYIQRERVNHRKRNIYFKCCSSVMHRVKQ